METEVLAAMIPSVNVLLDIKLCVSFLIVVLIFSISFIRLFACLSCSCECVCLRVRCDVSVHAWSCDVFFCSDLDIFSSPVESNRCSIPHARH